MTLVDVRSDPIKRITPAGLETGAAAHEADRLVFATGFDAMTGALLGIDVRGRGGATLRDRWAHGPHTYLGLQVAGFPNFFTITGPQSPSVVNNMPVSIEQHVEWISDCIKYLSGAGTIEATDEAEDARVQHTAEIADMTILEGRLVVRGR